MGRGVKAMLLVLVGLGLQPATASAVDGDGEVTFTVPFQASHGLSVKLEADDDEIELSVTKRGQQAAYIAPGEVTREGIAAKFGDFGEFVVDYEPFRTLETHGPNRHCEGEPNTTTEGFFRGTMRFRGEDGYISVDAARVKGTMVLQPQWECDYYRTAAASRARGGEADDDEATLAAQSHRDPIRFSVFGSHEKGERPNAFFIATSQEAREGVDIFRITYAGSRSVGFEFDNRRGTAVVDPPAPYAGSAYYRRRPNAPDRWTGSLTAPLLGLGRVRLAGPGFVAAMVPRLPQFE